MKDISVVILSVLGLLLLGAFVGWRVHVAAHTLTTVEGLVYDQFSSHMGPKDHACGELAGLTAALLARPTRPETKLTIMEFGNSRTGGEPVLLTVSDAVPARRNVASGVGRLKKDRAIYLGSIHRACMDAPSPEYSAIYSTVGRMIEHVRISNYGTAAACAFWVSTDGLENVLVPLRDQLAAAPNKTSRIP